MGRTGYARVVVADGLLAFAGEAFVVQMQAWCDEPAQVVLDRGKHTGARPGRALRRTP